MSQTRKKPEPTKKSTVSALNKARKPAKTQKRSKATTTDTALTQNSVTSASEKPEPRASSASSSRKSKTKSSALSPHDVLRGVKRRSIMDRLAGGSGWVKRTPEEHAGFCEIAEGLRSAMGRPRRDPSGTAKVVSFRFSESEMQHIESSAKKKGFESWREYVRARLLGA